MRIIALVPGGIGDQILFFPTLDDLKQAYPEAQIDVVVEPRAKDAYRVSKSVHETVMFDFQGRNSLADFGNLLGVLRDRGYDIVLCRDSSWAIGFLLWLTGIPSRIGYCGRGQSFLTQAVPLKPEQYVAASNHDLLQGLEIYTPCPELAVSVPTKDLDWADAERKRLGIQSSGYVLIHPGASDEPTQAQTNQRYPVESWRGILRDFAEKQPDLPIVLVQTAADADTIAALVVNNPKLRVTVPSDVGKLTAMIAGANLLICTDAASMHLAVAAKTYTLALFGAADPKKLLPDDKRFVGLKSLTGQLADLSPQTVLERVWGG